MEETGMASFITSITSGLSTDALWGAIAPCAAFIIAVTLFAIGYRVVRKNIRRAPGGKGGTV